MLLTSPREAPSTFERTIETMAGHTSVPRWVRAERIDASTFLLREAEFRVLAKAAPEANAFLEPAMLDAVQRADPTVPIVVLLAWSADGDLVGVWAFAVRSGVIGRLAAPAVPLATLATPVIRPGWAEAALTSWFALVAADRTLPKLLDVKALGADGPVYSGLDRLVAAGHCARRVIAHYSRPMLDTELAPGDYLKQTLSGSRRSKLRQLRAKLGRRGKVCHVVHEGTAVAAATDAFLTLEAGGWKGRRRSAMLSDPKIAAFVRAGLAGLAARGLAAITALTLDGRPVSMCVLLRSGGTAFTWKIAYDEAAGAYSPGYQLALDDTTALMADPAVIRTDSCASTTVGIMGDLWRERAEAVDLFIDVRPNGFARFRATMAVLAVVGTVPELRRRLRLGSKLKPMLRALRARRR